MTKFSYIFSVLLSVLIAFSSCDDLLNVDSKRLTAEDEYRLSTPGDSVYSMFGLLTQLQKLGDSYVLLGELRADLMDVTENSDPDLRKINQLEVNQTNSFVNIKNYYAVINNCNYILQHLDTAYVDKGKKLQLRQFAAVKAIRAWTYMQIALNFEKVKYYTDPILTIEDAAKTFPEYNMAELTPLLIADLEPVKDVDVPSMGNIGNYNSAFSFFPVRFVLGDLYLWMGALDNNNISYYEKAATQYRQLMFDKRIVIDKNNYSYWIPVNNTISSNAYLYWQRAFTLGSGEVISTITCPTEYGQTFLLDTLNNQHRIAASQLAINNWNSQTYYLNEASNAMGDLRQYGSVSYSPATNAKLSSDYYFSGVTAANSLIYKFKIYEQNVIVYRSALLYLRYAEAVNRLGKPNLAFAVLKYGLNSTNIFDTDMIPLKERSEATLPSYMAFSDMRFANNVGVRMRGLGNMDKDTTFFVIREQATLADSVLYVEDVIQQELALETAFEGNRFHDLMRFAIRRDDNEYLANIIAPKHGNNAAAIKTKLLNRANWYVK